MDLYVIAYDEEEQPLVRADIKKKQKKKAGGKLPSTERAQ